MSVFHKNHMNLKRQQLLYNFFSWSEKYTLLELQEMLELEGTPASLDIIQRDIVDMSRFQKIHLTDSNPPKYFIDADHYRDILDSIEYINNLKNPEGAFKVLDYLYDIRKKEIRKIRFNTRVLIEHLLKFDNSINKKNLLRSWYLAACDSSERIKEMLEDSPSLVKLFEPNSEYNDARKEAARDLGIDINLLPELNPYNVFDIALNESHLLFRVFEELSDK